MNSGSRRIVAIDYDASIGQRLRAAFPEPDYDFHWFADGREALGRLDEIRPDVIVCDLMLPGLDGRAVLDSVRSSPALRDVPFLVLSGVRSQATIRATLDAGAQAFLVKPCPISQLKQTIDKVLEEAALGPERDPGEASRRQVEGLRLIAGAGPGGAAAHGPADTVRLEAPEEPIVYEGRVSTLDLEGASYQVQTVAEGAPHDVAITTTVTSGGRRLRRAQSRLADDDPTALKGMLDGQHERALEATRQLHAQGRLASPPAKPAVEPPHAADPPVATPVAAHTGEPPARSEGPRPRTPPLKEAPPPPSATDTVGFRPATRQEAKWPEAKRPEASRPALDTVLLEQGPREADFDEGEILTEFQRPPRRTFWYYLPRAVGAVVGLGVLAILLEGPPDAEPPESAEVAAPESAAPLEPSAGDVPEALPTAAPSAPSASASAGTLAAPSAAPTSAATPSVAASARPTATPTVAPVARAIAAPPAEPSARPSPKATPEPPSAQQRTAEMARGRLQLAQALYEKGRFDEARTALNEVFKLAPSDAQARQLAARIERSVAGMVPFAAADGAPEEDHQAVLALLGRYETALENGDVTRLQAVWPGVDPEEVRERRQSLRSWQLSLRLIDLEVTGDQAVALCVSYDNMVTAEGERIENSSRISFHLRRVGRSWLIEAVK
jgi:CheY-like chemotaxis protein